VVNFLVVFMFFSFPVWAEDALKPADFGGAMVYSGREGSLLILEIPLEVYQAFRRPDLGDIRIFDSTGNPVPFDVRERPNELFTPPPGEVPFFTWYGGTEIQFPANSDIEINTSGGVVRIKNQYNLSGSYPAFLVDLSLLKYAPSVLTVKFGGQGGNFNIPVTIHYSGDLSDWKTFDKKQVLASFGSSIRDTLDLPETEDIKSMRYLLINFGWKAPAPVSMTVSFAPREKPGEYHEVIIQGNKSPDGKTVTYNTGAFYPAESVDFVLTEADSIPVLVKNRYTKNDKWNILSSGTLFRYNTEGKSVKNAPFGIASQAPYWELEATGGVLFSSLPECVIRWKPREIIFPARGKGPWTLAYGNAACPLRGQGEFLPLNGNEKPEPAFFTGEKRYERTDLPNVKDNGYRVFILWGVLGAAVILLSFLAFTIAKSMKR